MIDRRRQLAADMVVVYGKAVLNAARRIA